jgi:hypothetical protein
MADWRKWLGRGDPGGGTGKSCGVIGEQLREVLQGGQRAAPQGIRGLLLRGGELEGGGHLEPPCRVAR